MANPENQIRSFIQMDTFAYPLNNPFFKMKTRVSMHEKFNIHPSSYIDLLSFSYLLITLTALLSSTVLKTQIDAFPVPAVPYI